MKRKKRFLGVALTLVVLVIAGAVAYYSANKNRPKTYGSISEAISKTARSDVIISGSMFEPDNLTVSKNAMVYWLNFDNVPQGIAESDGQTGPNNSNILPTKSYGFQFKDTGVYHYRLTTKPNVRGTITVQ